MKRHRYAAYVIRNENTLGALYVLACVALLVRMVS